MYLYDEYLNGKKIRETALDSHVKYDIESYNPGLRYDNKREIPLTKKDQIKRLLDRQKNTERELERLEKIAKKTGKSEDYSNAELMLESLELIQMKLEDIQQNK